MEFKIIIDMDELPTEKAVNTYPGGEPFDDVVGTLEENQTNFATGLQDYVHGTYWGNFSATVIGPMVEDAYPEDQLVS